MIGAVNATGCENELAPALEPTVSSTAMNEAAPMLRPQKMTWSAHGQTRCELAALPRTAANSTLVSSPTKYVWLSAVKSPGPGPRDGAPRSEERSGGAER